MLDIINIVHKNQRLANVYITIIGQFATDCHRLASTKLFSLAKTLLGRKFILFGLEKVQLGSMTLLFSSFLFIISKFYNSTIIVKIQLNDNKLKNINLLFTTQGKIIWL
jgi:hypothetical protein